VRRHTDRDDPVTPTQFQNGDPRLFIEYLHLLLHAWFRDGDFDVVKIVRHAFRRASTHIEQRLIELAQIGHLVRTVLHLIHDLARQGRKPVFSAHFKLLIGPSRVIEERTLLCVELT